MQKRVGCQATTYEIKEFAVVLKSKHDETLLALLSSDRHNATRNADHHEECDCFEVALMCDLLPLRCDEVIQTVTLHYCATHELRWKTYSFE